MSPVRDCIDPAVSRIQRISDLDPIISGLSCLFNCVVTTYLLNADVWNCSVILKRKQEAHQLMGFGETHQIELRFSPIRVR